MTLTGQVASFVTTIAGNNGATKTTWPNPGGTFKVQFVVDYTDGRVAKSRVYPITIWPSLA